MNKIKKKRKRSFFYVALKTYLHLSICVNEWLRIDAAIAWVSQLRKRDWDYVYRDSRPKLLWVLNLNRPIGISDQVVALASKEMSEKIWEELCECVRNIVKNVYWVWIDERFKSTWTCNLY